MDTSLRLADYYFSMLKSLSNKTKLYLIKKLTDSMLENKETATAEKSLEDLFGIWANNPEADDMEEAIRKGRVSNVTRHIVSFDESKLICYIPIFVSSI